MSQPQTASQPASPRAGRRSGSTTLLIVAIALGLVTVILTNLYISAVRSEAAAEQITIYELNKNVAPGHQLDADDDLRKVRVPAQFKESMSDAITPSALPNWNGQAVKRYAQEGDPLTFDLFTAAGQAVDHQIADGMRGTPLPLTSRTAPGLLRPGMFIDILATFHRDGEQKTLVVMERVKVVAVGAQTAESEGEARGRFNAVTVEVAPGEARALLTVARHVGEEGFDAIVRNPKDEQTRFIGINPAVQQIVGIETSD